LRCASAAALAIVALAGCGANENTVRADLLRGVEEVRAATHDDHRLRRELSRTLRRLAADDGGSDRDRRARRLALRGFALMRSAAASRIAFVENDSGNLYAAKRDAGRAYHASLRGGELLRAAARLYDVKLSLSPTSR
jgi:hypothetical protein